MNFDEFYYRYFDQIFNYILRRTGDYDTSLDIVQETFFRAFEYFEKIKTLEEPAQKSYLYKISASQIVNVSKKQKKTTDLSTVENTITKESNIDKIEISLDAQNVIDTMKKLPRKYREALSLRYLEELEYSEIAEIMRRKESSVRSLVSRGIGKLKIIIT